MIALSPKLPQSATIVSNLLSDPQHPHLLVANVMLVVLSSGIEIDVGWGPEDDPNGAFRISVYQGDWDNPLIEPIEKKEPKEVLAEVERLAELFSRGAVKSWSPSGVAQVQTFKSLSGSASQMAVARQQELQHA